MILIDKDRYLENDNLNFKKLYYYKDIFIKETKNRPI